MFEGVNSSRHLALWTTDRTATGTVGLTSIAGAGITPSDLTVLGNDGLFRAVNASGVRGLWTAGGSHEITGIAGAATTGIDPSDLTVFNDEALFNGVNSTPGKPVSGLWVTNGTAAGTHEVTGITGADASGWIPAT